MARKRQTPPAPWTNVRGSSTALGEAREIFVPTESELSLEKLNKRVGVARSNLFVENPGPALRRHSVERDFRRRWEREFPDGAALLDFIAARGVSAFRSAWLLDALERCERITRGDYGLLSRVRTAQGEPALSSADLDVVRTKAVETLRGIGPALVCEGRGRKKRLTDADFKRIERAYRELLPKVQQVAEATREAIDDIRTIPALHRRDVAAGYARRFHLNVELCHDIVTLHLDRSPPEHRQPSRIAVREIARQFLCGIRTVEKAIASGKSGTRSRKAHARKK